MRKNINLQIIATAFLAVACGLTSCSDSDFFESRRQAESRITFSATMETTAAMTRAASSELEAIPLNGDGQQLWLLPSVVQTTSSPFRGDQRGATRGTQITSADDIQSFGVSAFRHDKDDEDLSGAKPSYFYNLEAELTDAENGIYTFTQDYFWPSNGEKLDFQAYYPYNNENISLSEKAKTDNQEIVFTVNSNIKKQCDFMTAVAKDSSFWTSLTPSVKMKFYHRLTAVKFVIGSQFVNKGTITKITLKGVYGSGVYTLGQEVGAGWTPGNTKTDFSLTRNISATATAGTAVTAADETFLMIPQDFTGDTNASIEVIYTDGTTNGQHTVTASLEGQVWEEGTTVTYAISSQKLTTLHISAINFATTVTGAPKTDWETGDRVGMYVVDGNSSSEKQIVHANVPLTYSSGSWTIGSTVYDRPGYLYYFYYPYKGTSGTSPTGYPTESPKVNATATEFFATPISDWTLDTSVEGNHADQSTLGYFKAADLQVAKATNDAAVSTISATMERQVGLARFTFAPEKTIPHTLTDTNNDGLSSSGGVVTIIPTATMSGNKAYISSTGICYFFTKAGVKATFKSANNDHRWKEDIEFTLNAGEYTAENDMPTVEEYRTAWSCIKRIWNYPYTNSYSNWHRKFVSTDAGTYTMECWGASGGGTSTLIGYGGYTAGDIVLNTPTTFHIFTGQQGAAKGTNAYNYNGGAPAFGGKDESDYSGGGATDIRIKINSTGAWNDVASLCSRIMVAAGGGGYDDNTNTAAFAGGLEGYWGQQGTYTIQKPNQFHGGYITSESYVGGFGHGYITETVGSSSISGGGSGYYGGGSSDAGTQGGSSYISGHAGCVAITAEVTSEANITPKGGTSTTTPSLTVDRATHYSGYAFTNTVMIDGAGYRWTTTKGSLQAMPKPGGSTYASGVGHTGNGYVRITLDHTK